MFGGKSKIHKVNKILVSYHQSYFILHPEEQSREEKCLYWINQEPEVSPVSPNNCCGLYLIKFKKYMTKQLEIAGKNSVRLN